MSDPAPHSPAKPTRRAAEGPGEATAAGLPEVVAAPRRQIDTHLASTLDLADLPPRLREAMAYATLSGGKRLRPLLAWHACVAAGGEGPEALPACAAVELVHCFSLVHDDLPALDDDDMRRGRPTLHRHAGEAMAILAGDALLTHAFGVLAGTGPPETARTLCRELSEACERMIAGQVLDTLGAGEHGGPGESDEDRLEAIHRGKTGAMLVASVRMGALSVPGCPDATLDALTAYGHAAGLMFQVVDDLLDAGGHLAPNLGVVELTIACTTSSTSATIGCCSTSGTSATRTSCSPAAAPAAEAAQRGGMAGFPEPRERLRPLRVGHAGTASHGRGHGARRHARGEAYGPHATPTAASW
jgi:geranylgeranyl diphosphate synthase, type II